MRKASAVYLWFLFLSLFFPISLCRATISWQVDAVSRYVWRGFDLFPPDHPALQPQVTVDFGKSGLSLNLWSSFPLRSWDALRDAAEADLTLAYGKEVSEKLYLSGGFIHYGYYFGSDFSFKENTSQELFVSAEFSDVFLSPLAILFYDVNLGSGFYGYLRGSHEFLLQEGRSALVASASLGYNSRQYIDVSGFSDLVLGLSWEWSTGKIKIAPSLNYALVFLDEVNEENEFWLGISLSFPGD